MQNGLYTATSGLLMQQNRVDSISNNLANMNTNGYKRDRAVFSVYRPEDKRYPQNFIRESHYNKTINTAVLLHENSANFEMGHIKETGNKFDFAIQQDNAFFAIDTPWGIRYTKDGAFTINDNGELVTAEGYRVMSRNAEGTANIVVDIHKAAGDEDILILAVRAVPQIPDLQGRKQGDVMRQDAELALHSGADDHFRIRAHHGLVRCDDFQSQCSHGCSSNE